MTETKNCDPDQILEGLEMLLDDWRYVWACLRRIPVQHHPWTLSRYRQAWERGVAEVQAAGLPGHAWHNAGRRAANVWLRTLLEHRRLPVPAPHEYTPPRYYS